MITHMARACALFLFVVTAGCGNTPPQQLLPIGSPCTASSQCGSDPAFFCDKDHPGGYCKRDCKMDADCPPEAICAFDGPTVGECHKRCNTVDDCRQKEGYVCKPSSTDPNMMASHAFCDVPDELPDAGMDMAADDGAASTDGGHD